MKKAAVLLDFVHFAFSALSQLESVSKNTEKLLSGHGGTLMEGDYATEPEDETSVLIVRQIRIAEFINNVVAKRRFDHLVTQL